MAAKYDAVYAQQVQVERLAEKDDVFARNYRALTFNTKFRQLKPCVTDWLVRSALARERRQQPQAQQHRAFTPTRNVSQVERELFG